MTAMPSSGIWQRVVPEVFSSLFPRESKDGLHPSTLAALASVDSRFRPATREEYDRMLLRYFDLLHRSRLARSTPQNHAAWLRGWAENLREIETRDPSAASCKPRYHRDDTFLRWKKDLAVSPNPQIGYDLYVAARHQLFRYWLGDCASIHELGSGSGDNLWLLQELFPGKRLRGYDWVEPAVKIANLIGSHTGNDVAGTHLDFLEPPERLSLGENAAVISVHSLEQVDIRFGPVLETLLRSKPSLVFHYEPIVEYYDNDRPLDYLARWYTEKRGYLRGLIGALRHLQDEGRIEILHEHRPGLGGSLHEASVVVWRPL